MVYGYICPLNPLLNTDLPTKGTEISIKVYEVINTFIICLNGNTPLFWA